LQNSFTRARAKPLFVPNTKVWFAFMGVAVVMMLGFYGFLRFKSADMKQQEAQFDIKREQIASKINQIHAQTVFAQKQHAFYQGLIEDNAVLKDSIRNLFELIPDQITLRYVKMEQETLILKGITPSREVYSFLLAVPLKSIFTTSDAEFYMLSNSWYNFVSVNRLDIQEGLR
jgi:Tfp pilus assembly protein PilN